MPSVTGQLPQAADAEMETGVQKFTVESSWGQHLTDTERGGERKGEGGRNIRVKLSLFLLRSDSGSGDSRVVPCFEECV